MPLPIGTRLIVDKCKATVRYVGAVDSQQGTWVGLEWDEVSRGRHNGTVGGKRYFSCKDSAPRGSFVREAKLFQVADLGTKLPLAITRRCGLHSHTVSTAFVILWEALHALTDVAPHWHASRIQDVTARFIFLFPVSVLPTSIRSICQHAGTKRMPQTLQKVATPAQLRLLVWRPSGSSRRSCRKPPASPSATAM